MLPSHTNTGKRHITKKMTLNEIQFIMANAIRLHPLLYAEFIKMVIELERKGSVCALPITTLQHYMNCVEQRLESSPYKCKEKVAV